MEELDQVVKWIKTDTVARHSLAHNKDIIDKYSVDDIVNHGGTDIISTMAQWVKDFPDWSDHPLIVNKFPLYYLSALPLEKVLSVAALREIDCENWVSIIRRNKVEDIDQIVSYIKPEIMNTKRFVQHALYELAMQKNKLDIVCNYIDFSVIKLSDAYDCWQLSALLQRGVSIGDPEVVCSVFADGFRDYYDNVENKEDLIDRLVGYGIDPEMLAKHVNKKFGMSALMKVVKKIYSHGYLETVIGV